MPGVWWIREGILHPRPATVVQEPGGTGHRVILDSEEPLCHPLTKVAQADFSRTIFQ